MKHLYFHSSNLGYTSHLNQDVGFQRVSQYPSTEVAKTHRHEWGRIKTGNNYIHLILGNLPMEDCPWCGTYCQIRKISEDDTFDMNPLTMSKYCLECIKCGSRGPILNVSNFVEQDKKNLEELHNLIRQRFNYRRHWDTKGFDRE